MSSILWNTSSVCPEGSLRLLKMRTNCLFAEWWDKRLAVQCFANCVENVVPIWNIVRISPFRVGVDCIRPVALGSVNATIIVSLSWSNDLSMMTRYCCESNLGAVCQNGELIALWSRLYSSGHPRGANFIVIYWKCMFKVEKFGIFGVAFAD